MRYLSIISIVLLTHAASAQNSVWNSAGKAKDNAVKKTGKTVAKAKDFKKHLQQWGLDTGYHRAFLAGGKLNTDGWSGSLYFMKRASYSTSRVWQIHFSEVKHEKQVKQQGSNKSFPELGNPAPYVFGKINNLYTLQVGYGRETLLLPGVMEGNISVSMRYSFGLSLAMLKPYYLKLEDIDYTTNPATAHIKEAGYSQADSALFLNPNRIFGASSWTKSLNKIDYVPGGFIDAAVVLTPGKNKNFVQVITLGCNASAYYKELPIMEGQKAYPWEVCLYAGLGIGKRW